MAAEDSFYNEALQLVDDAVLRLRDATEAGTLRDGQFNLLSYLLTRYTCHYKEFGLVLHRASVLLSTNYKCTGELFEISNSGIFEAHAFVSSFR